MKQASTHGDATDCLQQTDGSGMLNQIERILAVPVNLVERGITLLLTTPVKPVWKWLDAMSPQFEKTRAARTISYIIYPLAILAALVFGLLIASKGLNSGALLHTAIYSLSLGGIIAVLERLMPWSRN